MRLHVTLSIALAALASCSGGGGSSPSPQPAGAPPPPPVSGTLRVGALGLLDGRAASESVSSFEHVRDVAFDSAGNMYVAGGTPAPDFPTTAGAYDQTFGGTGSALGNSGPMDAFVTKFSPSGTMLWSTYIGGPNYDRAYALEVDNAGNVYIAGRAGQGFPTTPGAAQPGFGGDTNPNPAYGPQDGFVAKLSTDGSTLLWSTFFGGNGRGFIRDIDIDPQGRVHLAAIIDSNLNHITSNAVRTARQGTLDVVYGVLTSDGSGVEYATYLGGTSTGSWFSANPSLRVASDGGAVVAFYDNATDVQTTSGAFQTANAGGFDIVVSRLTATRTLAWTTYYGGNVNEDLETHTLALTASDAPIIAGRTASKNLPTTTGVIQPSPGSSSSGDRDGFIAALSSDGRQVLAATYLGGTGTDEVEGVAILPDGSILASGVTGSDTLPVTSGAHQAFRAGGQDAFLVRLSTDLQSVIYASYFGGSSNDAFRTLAAGPSGAIGAGGQTRSTDFPTVNSVDMAKDGNFAAVYARLQVE